MSLLSERAVLMTLSMSAWSARKYDRKVSDDTNKKLKASNDGGRWNKLLLPKEAISPIQKIDGEIYSHYREVTSPWLDRDGTRILSVEKVEEEYAWFQNKRQEREIIVKRFIDKYPEYLEKAPAHVGEAYNPADYPVQSSLPSKFRMKFSVDKIPEGEDFRLKLGNGQEEDIRRQIEENAQEAIGVVLKDAYARVADVVGHMVERLRAYKPGTDSERAEGIFHSSLVDNVAKLVDLLPSLNVTNDPGLAKIVERMKDLTVEDALVLRMSDTIRTEVADEADKILKDVNDFLA